MLLPLGVGAPEVSAWIALAALLGLVLAGTGWRTRPTARIAAVMSFVALALAVYPLAAAPGVAQRAEQELRTQLGENVQAAPSWYAGERPGALVVRELLTGFAHDSARVTRNVIVTEVAGDALTMDIYQPLAPSGTVVPRAARSAAPVIVQVYGGAWQRGEPADFAEFARYFAARGFVVFAIDYRHAPEHRYPAQLEDVRASLAWIGANAARFGADTGRMLLLGRSAGAHLAMLAAYTPGAPRVRGVISYYGPVDLTEGYRDPPRPDPLSVRDIEEAFLGSTPAEKPELYREASPISYADVRQPPTLLVYGGRDHIVEPRFGRMLRDSLRAHGTTVVHVEIPWAEHAFDAVPNGPGGQLARYVTERFALWAVSAAHD